MSKRLIYCTVALLSVMVCVLGALWLSTVGGVLAAGGTRYVAKPPDGDDSSNDCTNPASPCATVQHAVDVASAGETIKVAGGTYTDTHTVTALGGPVVVELTKTVTLRGAYDTSFSEPPNGELNPTALDAEGGARVVYVSGAGPTIENFIITGGSSTGSGAGVYVDYGSPTLRGNVIIDNASGGGGGGVLIIGGSGLIEWNEIISNTAGWGGGLQILNDADVAVVRNLIINNTAGWDGGGVDLEGHSAVTPHVHRNIIMHNSASFYGGGLSVEGARASVMNNILAHNHATYGAAVYLERTGPSWPVSATLAHNTLVGDLDTEEAVLANGYVTATLQNNIIADFHIGISYTTPASGTVNADYTLFYNNDTKYGSGVNSTNEVSGNPEFINSGEDDYHIAPHSAAFDAALDIGAQLDFEDDRRPSGMAPDVGADEVAPLVHVPLALKRY